MKPDTSPIKDTWSFAIMPDDSMTRPMVLTTIRANGSNNIRAKRAQCLYQQFVVFYFERFKSPNPWLSSLTSQMLTLLTGDSLEIMACIFIVTLQTDTVALQHLSSMLSNKLLLHKQ